MTMLSWTQARLNELEPLDVYDLLALRAEVFVLEQNCAFLDPDSLDKESVHLLGRDADGTLVAYLRIVDAGAKYVEPSIGRVVTKPNRRRQGLGKELMREGIVRTQILWQDRPIRIGAQYRLEEFYQELGFESHGAVYIEDAIEHIEMVLAGNTPLHGYPREHST